MNVHLSEIAEIKAGHTFRGKAEDPDRTEGVRLIQIKDIKERGVDIHLLNFAAIGESRVSNVLEEGDVLFPLRGARVEAMVFPSCGGEEVITTNQVAIIKVSKGVARAEYVSWYLNSEAGERNVSGLKVGSVVSNIGLKDLAGLVLPVPKLSVQDEILALHSNWLARKVVLSKMLVVGEQLSERSCFKLLG
ncbi:restriction endonuclease subunit M [Pseudomonas sp. EggHat1]|uniref:restriction endonuclease subunit M n=1 Tax=Pseudomonas sp. EggHat1 TaxID=2761624 RepID=UPI0018679300|nr:restriction endonuclease subunit M [Pseudomonas sp. EggHat1]